MTETLYLRENVPLETAKSAVVGGVTVSGMTAILYPLFKWLLTRKSRFEMIPDQLLSSTGMLALTAAFYYGAEKNTETRIINTRRNLLNRHAGEPDIQQELKSQIGSITHYDRPATNLEKAIWTTNIAALGLNFYAHAPGSRLYGNSLVSVGSLVTSGVCGVAWVASNIVNNHSEHGKEHKRLAQIASKVEQLAQQRAASMRSLGPSPG